MNGWNPSKQVCPLPLTTHHSISRTTSGTSTLSRMPPLSTTTLLSFGTCKQVNPLSPLTIHHLQNHPWDLHLSPQYAPAVNSNTMMTTSLSVGVHEQVSPPPCHLPSPLTISRTTTGTSTLHHLSSPLTTIDHPGHPPSPSHCLPPSAMTKTTTLLLLFRACDQPGKLPSPLNTDQNPCPCFLPHTPNSGYLPEEQYLLWYYFVYYN